MRRVAVVGGSLAGLSAVRSLRAQGYDGTISVISDETRPPYDRPPLSKDFLAGAVSEAELALLGDDEALEFDRRSGRRATALHPARGSVELSDGTEVVVDAVIAATGARARMPWPVVPAGVLVLRTLDDAEALKQRLVPGVRLVVVGAGFIGAEVASTARRLGAEVTVVEAAATPLTAALGVEMGAVLGGLHADHGVRLLTGVGVTGFAGAGHVTSVLLSDGRSVPADVVLVGVGIAPNVGWLTGTPLTVAGGVRCDAYGATDLPNVVAVGDCAAWFDPAVGAHHRVEHWAAARERPAVAVRTLLSGGTERSEGRPPYFWSDQYGVRVQLTGWTAGADTVTIEEGSIDERDFVAVYRRGGEPIGVLALGRSRSFMRWRKQFASRVPASPAASPAG